MATRKDTIKAPILLSGDLIVMYLALTFTLFVRYGGAGFSEAWGRHLHPFSVVFAVWFAVFYIVGLYDHKELRDRLGLLAKSAEGLAAAFVVSLGIFYLIPGFRIAPKTNLVVAISVFAVLFALWRLFTIHLFTRPIFRSRALFLGVAPETDDLCLSIRENEHLGYECVGYIKDPAAGTTLPESDVIVVSHLVGDRQDLTRTLFQRYFSSSTIIALPDFHERIRRTVAASALSEQWVLNNLAQRDADIYDHLKRPIDAALAVILLLPVSVVMLLVASLVWLGDRHSVFFRQARVGLGGRIFTMLKFRTMREGAESSGAAFASENDSRVTPVGRFLRRTRLDELPQIWNILRGDMSFIGPRPERPEFESEISKTIPLFPVRHVARPGLTGWAQINAPYAASSEDHLRKLLHDLYYLKHRSFTLDATILLKTVYSVVKRRGR
jgi:exopolysaccharide biosynthesis polyprenyl glycosylphosphotransferase